MYPYSEFIQGDIYEKNHLDLSGKMKDDFELHHGEKYLENILLMKFLRFLIGFVVILTLWV